MQNIFCAILEEGIKGNIPVKLLLIWTSGSGGHLSMSTGSLHYEHYASLAGSAYFEILRTNENQNILKMSQVKQDSPSLAHAQSKEAQWLSGRVLDSRPRGRGFEPHWRHCVVSLSKTH